VNVATINGKQFEIFAPKEKQKEGNLWGT